MVQMQAEIETLQQIIAENRLLLEQLPQLKKQFEELKSTVDETVSQTDDE